MNLMNTTNSTFPQIESKESPRYEHLALYCLLLDKVTEYYWTSMTSRERNVQKCSIFRSNCPFLVNSWNKCSVFWAFHWRKGAFCAKIEHFYTFLPHQHALFGSRKINVVLPLLSPSTSHCWMKNSVICTTSHRLLIYLLLNMTY
jgi:hypothetical protein